MKKKILIFLSVMLLIAVIIGTMYLIDKKRMKDNKSVMFSTWGYSYAPPMVEIEEDKIVLNSDYIMSIICYDAESREINEDLEELQNLKYPSTLSLARALAVYVRSNIENADYDELHDIFLHFEGEDKNFTITMALGREPLTDYRDFENKSNYNYSLISGNEVAILHNDKRDEVNKKVCYTCIFEYDDVNFVIEATNLNQEEVVSLIKSIFNCNMKEIINKQLNKFVQ